MDHKGFMEAAIELAKKAPMSNKAFSVGAIVVCNGEIICTGYSRELSDSVHAEEVCIQKLSKMGIDPSTLVMYSTMEPCGERLSGKRCCAELIADSKIPIVVVGALEPSVFIKLTKGIEKLKEYGIQLIMLSDLQGIFSQIIRRKVFGT